MERHIRQHQKNIEVFEQAGEHSCRCVPLHAIACHYPVHPSPSECNRAMLHIVNARLLRQSNQPLAFQTLKKSPLGDSTGPIIWSLFFLSFSDSFSLSLSSFSFISLLVASVPSEVKIFVALEQRNFSLLTYACCLVWTVLLLQKRACSVDLANPDPPHHYFNHHHASFVIIYNVNHHWSTVWPGTPR